MAARPLNPQAQPDDADHPKTNPPQTKRAHTNHSQASIPEISYSQPSDALDEQPTGAASDVALKLRRRQESQNMHATPIYQRALWLMSDAIVLTLAAPFFAVWWIVRKVKRMTETR